MGGDQWHPRISERCSSSGHRPTTIQRSPTHHHPAVTDPPPSQPAHRSVAHGMCVNSYPRVRQDFDRETIPSNAAGPWGALLSHNHETKAAATGQSGQGWPDAQGADSGFWPPRTQGRVWSK